MEFLPKIIYHDDHLLLARKPHGIASSWGQEESFLDGVKKYCADSSSLFGMKRSGVEESLSDIRNHQISIFGEEEEYGMLNRLDTVTAGLLYFARSYEAKLEYMHIQDQGLITKTYYAQVYGIPRAQFGRITTPIYHHRDDASRMTTDPDKGRGKGQEVVTYYEVLSSEILDPRDFPKNQEPGTKNISRLKLEITSGCRHQIRCHLASMGHPIVGDRLYMTKGLKKRWRDEKRERRKDRIELVSVGLEMHGSEKF